MRAKSLLSVIGLLFLGITFPLLIIFTQQKQVIIQQAIGANELAQTPPMGWDQFNHFHDAVNSQILKQEADAMVNSGLKDAGYIYFSVDDSWAGTVRNPDGTISVDQTRFPSVNGINGVVDLINYVHAKGLKFGIYTTEGLTTCRGLLGSLGHEDIDMKTFASWGVDFVKIDNCSAWKTEQDIINSAKLFSDLSIKYNRPMVISMHVANTGFKQIDALYQYANMARFFRILRIILPV
ncbi:MAG TPA: glycoside hydrolase family 27 protein [Patescibacteria group bacterium]|nr:glycoside hydrolase family 27 protein [Patescibacteria group bacterium]